jgi:hypothetical protein
MFESGVARLQQNVRLNYHESSDQTHVTGRPGHSSSTSTSTVPAGLGTRVLTGITVNKGTVGMIIDGVFRATARQN